jgi:hypothetical protein
MTFPRRPGEAPPELRQTMPSVPTASKAGGTVRTGGAPMAPLAGKPPVAPGSTPLATASGPRPVAKPELGPRRPSFSVEDDGRVLAMGWLFGPSPSSVVLVTSARALAYRSSLQVRLDASGLTDARVARVHWASDLALASIPDAVAASLAKRLLPNVLRFATADATSFASLSAAGTSPVALSALEPSVDGAADCVARAGAEVFPGTPIVEPGGALVGVVVAQEGEIVHVATAQRIRKALDSVGTETLVSLTRCTTPLHACPACGDSQEIEDASAVLACRRCGAALPLSALPAGAPPELVSLRRWAVKAGLSRGLPRVRAGRSGGFALALPYRGQTLELDVTADGRWVRGRLVLGAIRPSEEVLRALVAENDRAPGQPGVIAEDGDAFVVACEPIAAARNDLRAMADAMVDRWDALVSYFA